LCEFHAVAVSDPASLQRAFYQMGLDNPYYPVVELARYFKPYSRRYADFETSGVDKTLGSILAKI